MAEEVYDVTIPVMVGLSPAHLNVVFKALEEQPFRLAAPVIEHIRKQVFEQMKAHHGQRADTTGAEES